MIHLLRLALGTVALRPYVFVFFGIYLFIAISTIGWKRTGLYSILAYLIAFVCEYTSSHGDLGIPFGVYRYVETTRDRELWIAGVPFMDSLSFTFLSFISYRLAIALASSRRPNAKDISSRWLTAGVAGFLMMYLDVIIDPVTLQGSRWFLGDLYYYPNGGPYFGVTIWNFIGWFVVCFIIVRVYVAIEKRLGDVNLGKAAPYFLTALAPALLYFSIMAFNLWVTFRIGERVMGWTGVLLCAPLAAVVVYSIRKGRQDSLRVAQEGKVSFSQST